MTDETHSSGDRDGPEGHPHQLFCACGEAWFEGGVISMEKSGLVNGLGGWWRCSACGAPMPRVTEQP